MPEDFERDEPEVIKPAGIEAKYEYEEYWIRELVKEILERYPDLAKFDVDFLNGLQGSATNTLDPAGREFLESITPPVEVIFTNSELISFVIKKMEKAREKVLAETNPEAIPEAIKQMIAEKKAALEKEKEDWRNFEKSLQELSVRLFGKLEDKKEKKEQSDFQKSMQEIREHFKRVEERAGPSNPAGQRYFDSINPSAEIFLANPRLVEAVQEMILTAEDEAYAKTSIGEIIQMIAEGTAEKYALNQKISIAAESNPAEVILAYHDEHQAKFIAETLKDKYQKWPNPTEDKISLPNLLEFNDKGEFGPECIDNDRGYNLSIRAGEDLNNIPEEDRTFIYEKDGDEYSVLVYAKHHPVPELKTPLSGIRKHTLEIIERHIVHCREYYTLETSVEKH